MADRTSDATPPTTARLAMTAATAMALVLSGCGGRTTGLSRTSGTAGLSGTSEPAGLSGTSETSDNAGLSGTSGTAGLSGTSETAGLSGTSGTSDNAGHAGHADVDALMKAAMTKLHIPGAAVAVVRGGQVEVQQGYGLANLELAVPVTPTTRFQIASSTKIFTATLVLRLVAEGLLALDQPVSRYLADAPAAWRAVTIGQLAAHAGGISEDLKPTTDTVPAAYAALRATALRFTPGAEARYGLGDFVVLARAIEVVTGQDFEAALAARVFAPLGFTCTGFDHAADDGPVRLAEVVPDRATVYRWSEGRQRAASYLYPTYTYASGGAFSCLADLTRWAVAMDAGTLVSAAVQRTAAASFRLADGRDAGFSVVFMVGALQGHPLFGHSGGPALADVLRFPGPQLTVIVLTNQQRVSPNLAARIARDRLPPSRARPDLARPAIADDDPALTARLRAVAVQMATGALDEAAFAPGLRAELVPALRAWGPITTAVLPALTSLALVSDDRTPGRPRLRTYRGDHAGIAVRWRFTLDAAGLIEDVDTAIE